MEKAKLEEYSAELGKTLGEALLTPTKIYVKPILSLIDAVEVHSIAHITGGGFIENIPRSIPKGLTAKIEKSTVRVPPVFRLTRSSVVAFRYRRQRLLRSRAATSIWLATDSLSCKVICRSCKSS